MNSTVLVQTTKNEGKRFFSDLLSKNLAPKVFCVAERLGIKDLQLLMKRVNDLPPKSDNSNPNYRSINDPTSD